MTMTGERGDFPDRLTAAASDRVVEKLRRQGMNPPRISQASHATAQRGARQSLDADQSGGPAGRKSLPVRHNLELRASRQSLQVGLALENREGRNMLTPQEQNKHPAKQSYVGPLASIPSLGFARRNKPAWRETVTQHVPEPWPAARLALQARIAALDIEA
jgi:hypothetical protein